MFSFIIGTIKNVIFRIYIIPKWEQYNFFFFFGIQRQFSEHVYFLIKFIYNILCIIKKYIKFGNYSFSFKQIFSNPIFSTL